MLLSSPAVAVDQAAIPEGFVPFGGPRNGGWIRADLAADAAVLWGEGRPLAEAAGRGGVFVATLGGVEAVVRPLRHGGAIARWLGDRYLGPARVREELRVHAVLHARGLPVIPPIAAAWRRVGLWGWQLRFATERVEAQPLTAAILAHPEQRGPLMAAAGSVVGAALGMGLEHPDLHPDNLLAAVDGGSRPRLWLLDFDRARLGDGAISPDGVDRTLLRFARYPFRHRARVGAYGLRDALRFLQGMGEPRHRRRETVARLAPRLQQALARRGLS